MVRARVRGDLENLRHLPALEGIGLPPVVLTPDADYPCRLVVTTAQKDAIVKALADGIDYGNFKSRVHERPDQTRKNRAYMEVWSAMSRTEEPGAREEARQVEKKTGNAYIDEANARIEAFQAPLIKAGVTEAPPDGTVKPLGAFAEAREAGAAHSEQEAEDARPSSS